MELLSLLLRKVRLVQFHARHDTIGKDSVAETFYDIKYGSSIITSNVRQINLSNENIKDRH